MKVLFPRHIKKGIFASMTFTVGPITVSLLQLFVLAMSAAWSFAVANYFLKQGHHKIIAIIFASPVFLVGLAIAFFEVSEMNLWEFIAKQIRTHFFDTNEKYQVNTPKTEEIDLIIKKNHSSEKDKKIIFKTDKELHSNNNDTELHESGLL